MLSNNNIDYIYIYIYPLLLYYIFVLERNKLLE